MHDAYHVLRRRLLLDTTFSHPCLAMIFNSNQFFFRPICHLQIWPFNPVHSRRQISSTRPASLDSGQPKIKSFEKHFRLSGLFRRPAHETNPSLHAAKSSRSSTNLTEYTFAFEDPKIGQAKSVCSWPKRAGV